MIRVGTVSEWWRISGRYPGLRQGRASFLKSVGYAFVLDEIDRLPGAARILEFGHGFSDTLPAELGHRHEVHSLDDFQGLQYFPSRDDWDTRYAQYVAKHPTCRVHRGLLGGRKNDLPDTHVDVVCSVSVLEEVSEQILVDIFADARRVLRPGGHFINSFDFLDDGNPETLNRYLRLQCEAGFDLEASGHVTLFRDDMATENQPTVMLYFNGQVPEAQRTWPGNWHTLLTSATKAAPEKRPRTSEIPTVTTSLSIGRILQRRTHARTTSVLRAVRGRLGRIRRRWVKR